MEGDGVQVLVLSSPSMTRVINPISYFLLDFWIRISLLFISCEGLDSQISSWISGGVAEQKMVAMSWAWACAWGLPWRALPPSADVGFTSEIVTDMMVQRATHDRASARKWWSLRSDKGYHHDRASARPLSWQLLEDAAFPRWSSVRNGDP